MSGRPAMMKLPPKITFYTQNRLYEGAGHPSKPAIIIGTVACMALAGVLSWWSIGSSRKKSILPGTFSEEWKAAEYAKRETRRADPIHDHTIGGKV